MENFDLKKNLKNVIYIIYAVIAVVGAYLFFKYVFGYILPFIIAFIIAFIVDPLVRFLNKKARLPRTLASFVGIIAVFSVLGLIIYFSVSRIIIEAYQLRFYLSQVMISIPIFWKEIQENLSTILNNLPLNILPQFDLDGILSAATNSLTEAGIRLLNNILNVATASATKIPGALLFILVTTISTFLISIDLTNIKIFLAKQIPLKWRQRLFDTKAHLFLTAFKYIKAQGILLSLTFTELLIGFNIIGVNYKLTLSIIIALFDALPILGTGTFLIPWAIICLLSGEALLAGKLFILYVTILIIRQTLEPKIVGHQIGLAPIITLMSMYIGANTLGFFGLFLGPVAVILLKFMHDSGYVKLFKK